MLRTRVRSELPSCSKLTWIWSPDTKRWSHWDCSSEEEWSFHDPLYMCAMESKQNSDTWIGWAQSYLHFFYPRIPRSNPRMALIASLSMLERVRCHGSMLKQKQHEHEWSLRKNFTDRVYPFDCAMLKRESRGRSIRVWNRCRCRDWISRWRTHRNRWHRDRISTAHALCRRCDPI